MLTYIPYDGKYDESPHNQSCMPAFGYIGGIVELNKSLNHRAKNEWR